MWNELYQKALTALAEGEIERFMKSTIENSRDMRASFQTTPNVTYFLNFLSGKAMEESLGFSEGAIPTIIMGGGG